MDKWYAIWVLTGKEKDALGRIRGLEGVRETILPTATLWQRKAGEWLQREQLLFPGYIFLRCRMDSVLYHGIRELPEVIGWLGRDTLWPTEISQEDMDRVAALMGNAPGRVLTDIQLHRRQRRGYGTMALQGREFRVPFDIYGQDNDQDKQGETTPGDASPEEEEPEQIRRNGAD